MRSTIFIGADVSQSTLDLATAGEAAVLKIANREAAIRSWLAGVPQGCRIGVESTGKLHLPLVRAALAAGHTVYVLNPRDLAHYSRALGRRAKTDRLDAQLLARYLEREHANLHPYVLPSELQMKFDELIRRRHCLVVQRQTHQQSVATMSCKLRSTQRLRRAYDAAVAEVDEQLQQLLIQDPQLNVAATRLRTVVGFGALLSCAMARAVTRLPFKNADAFVAYLGLDPRARDSGTMRGRRFLSKRGPAEMRRMIYAAAMSASRSKLWQPIYQRYRARGFAPTQAFVILARKLARIAFSMLRHGTNFQPERLHVTCLQP